MTARRTPEAEPNVDAATPQVTDDIVLKALTLALMRLTCWREGKGEFSFWRAWKGYDFKTLDRLQDQGLIAFRRANKSVELTDEDFLLGDALAAAFRAEMAQTLTNLEGPQGIEEDNMSREPDGSPR
ncbi:DUF6429 family protein [Collinsella intestinalis]|uniref:DUF6429 family protein n=1 Tax=Collinsella intestinalis TaxID=147207 RepID=UPI00195C3CCC|nr:DUF6429 family protein [Collinsella intestinalis]MBM6907153.1 hypothetical protein [Collinsella intestinalis]